MSASHLLVISTEYLYYTLTNYASTSHLLVISAELSVSHGWQFFLSICINISPAADHIQTEQMNIATSNNQQRFQKMNRLNSSSDIKSSLKFLFQHALFCVYLIHSLPKTKMHICKCTIQSACTPCMNLAQFHSKITHSEILNLKQTVSWVGTSSITPY